MLSDKEFASFQDGIFKAYFEKYIEFKRGKGEKVVRSTLVRLRALNNELNRLCGSAQINDTVAEAVLQEKSGESLSARSQRVSDFRQFSSFLRAHGIPAFQIPAKYTKHASSPFRPYIFSAAELCAVVEAADNYENKSRRKNPINVYPVIVRILIGTGMRIGEVLSLRVQDVDMEVNSLTIHCSKNNVSRHVPISASLALVIESYLTRLPHCHQPCQPLFKSHYTGEKYSYDAMQHMFKKFYALAGVATSRGKLPRIHDVRHTFCTTSLDKMLASGKSLYEAVPILAAFVGHVNLCDTERYIHFSEHGYNDFVGKQHVLQSLIPEVGSCEE